MKMIIITPTRNAATNLSALCMSINEQTDPRWSHHIIDDCSDEGHGITPMFANELISQYDRTVVVNDEQRWALYNIIAVARQYQDDPDIIIGTVDGDDELCNKRAVEIILKEYETDPKLDVLWTAQKWDVKEDMNVSRSMPDVLDPYEYPWCASHLRTFRASLLKRVSDENFKDFKGEWFRRGYDQALMLPLLKVARHRKYLDEVCYLYKMDSVSIPLNARAGTEVEQIHNISFIRARGFVS